jgi:hypothetical protein
MVSSARKLAEELLQEREASLAVPAVVRLRDKMTFLSMTVHPVVSFGLKLEPRQQMPAKTPMSFSASLPRR